MKRNKLLLLLALLMTAVTGAWATTPNSIVINGTPQAGDKSISLTYYFDPANVSGLDYGYAPTLKVKCAADNKWDEMWLDFSEVSSGTTNISLENLGEFEAGKTYDVCFAYNNGDWVDEVLQSFVPAAPATTYSVTLAEGTEDADKWTISPNPAAEGATVTVTYSGERKVKSVKAVKKAAKPDLLPAVFTVDAGKTVKFSKGNLQATYNGSSWIWGFAEHQWDYIGNAAGNTSINGNGTVSANGTVDLFGWVGASSTWTGAAQYGISNSTATNNVDGYGNVGGEAQKVGWGATVGEGWRTLTRPEWLYLLSTRETGITVNSTDNARYTLAIINTDGTAVKGLIIFPDSYAGGSPAGVTWGTINAKSTFETTCTSAGWTALEAAGCVFLPAAGYRTASTVNDAGDGAGYWSSSSSSAPYAFGLYFESDYMTIQYGGSRKYGFSVRLVRDAN